MGKILRKEQEGGADHALHRHVKQAKAAGMVLAPPPCLSSKQLQS